jgi:hypothetical protein
MTSPGWELRGDVIYTKTGGKVEGEILEGRSDESVVFVETSFGKVEIPRDEIERIEPSPGPPEEYTRRQKETPATAESQYALALWCVDNDLPTEYRFHLQEVIRLDPNHAAARKRLGFVQRQGQWLTEEEAKSADGYVKFRGKWVLPQERARQEADRAKDSRRQDLGRKIRLAQKGLRQVDKPDRVEAARDDLLAIDDPVAIPLLMNLLGKKGSSADREVLVEVLAGIDDPDSTDALVELCLEDSSPSNRLASARALLPRQSPALVGKFVQELKSNDNNHVRRAGQALAVLGDDSVVPSLVDALITRHERVYDPSFEEKLAGITGTSVRTTETVILPDGSMIRRNLLQGQTASQAFAPNVPQRQVIVETKENEEVLDALIERTGENFGYDQHAWRAWLDREYRDQAAGQRPADPSADGPVPAAKKGAPRGKRSSLR